MGRQPGLDQTDAVLAGPCVTMCPSRLAEYRRDTGEGNRGRVPGRLPPLLRILASRPQTSCSFREEGGAAKRVPKVLTKGWEALGMRWLAQSIGGSLWVTFEPGLEGDTDE